MISHVAGDTSSQANSSAPVSSKRATATVRKTEIRDGMCRTSILPHPLGDVEVQRAAITSREGRDPLSLNGHGASKTKQIVNDGHLQRALRHQTGGSSATSIVTMRLKTKLLLASSAIVLIVLTLSEWIGYRQTSQFLNGHEMRMASEMNHGAVLADLQQGRQALLLRSATLHTFHGIITIIALILALNALWSRTVLRPLADLLRHINYMRRGSWGTPVPVRSKDEIGELTEAFNELGGQLTLTVHQFAAASKLSALALLGQSLVKKVVSAAELVRAAQIGLDRHSEDSEDATSRECARLQRAVKLLEEIPLLFDAEFQRELSQYSASPAPPTGLPEDQAASHQDTHVQRSCPARP